MMMRRSREEEAENHDVPAITHSVVFKCVGANKEMHYHVKIARLGKQMGEIW